MKTQLLSLSFLENKVTRSLYFFVIPIINLLFLLLMATQYKTHSSWILAISSVIFSGALLSMSSMSELLVTDYNLHIDREMVAKNPYSLKYWGNKFIVSVVAGIILSSINLLLLLLLKAPIDLILSAFISSIILCISGTLVGAATFIFSWRMANPYFFSNLIATLAIVISGVVVPIINCPKWIQHFSLLLPFARTIAFGTKTDNYKGLLIDILIDLIWIIFTIFIYTKQVIKVKENPKL